MCSSVYYKNDHFQNVEVSVPLFTCILVEVPAFQRMPCTLCQSIIVWHNMEYYAKEFF